MKAIKLIIIIFLFFVSILFTTIAVVMYSNTVQKSMLKQVIKSINQSIPAKIQFEDFEGNLFQHFMIKDLKISYNRKTILSLHSLDMNYQFSALLKQKILIHSLSIDSLYIDFEIFKDRSNTFIRAFSLNKKTSESKKGNLPEITLNSFQITQSKICFTSDQKDQKFVKILNNINLKSQLMIRDNDIYYYQPILSFLIDDYPFQSKDIHLNISKEMIRLSARTININNSRFRVFSMLTDSLSIKKVYIESPKFDLSDIQLIKKDIGLSDQIYQIEGLFEQNPEFTKGDVLISDRNRKLRAQLSLSQKEPLKLNALITTSNFILSDALNETNKNRIGINDLFVDGQIKAHIEGNKLNGNNVTLDVNLTQMRINQELFTGIHLKLDKIKNLAIIKGESSHHQSLAKINAEIRDFFTHQQRINPQIQYQGSFTFKDLDLGNYINASPFDSLNIKHVETQFKGQGIDPLKADLTLKSQIKENTIHELCVDTLSLEVEKKSSDIDVKSFNIVLGEDQMNVSGRINISSILNKSAILNAIKELDFQLHLGRENLEKISHLSAQINPTFKLPQISAEGLSIQGQYNAKKREQAFESHLELQQIKADSLSAENIQLHLYAQPDLQQQGFQVQKASLNGLIKHIEIPPYQVNQIDLSSVLDGSELLNKLQIQIHDSLTVNSQMSYDFKQAPQIHFSDFQMISNRFNYRNTDDFVLSLDKSKYALDHFNIADGSSKIKLSAAYQTEKNIDLSLLLEQFNSDHLLSFIRLPNIKPSFINLNLDYTGTQNNGDLNFDLGIPTLETEYGKIDSLQFTIRQSEQKAMINATLKVANERISLSGNMPIVSHLKAIKDKNLILMDQAFELNIKSDPISLSQFNPHLKNQAFVDGNLKFDLHFYNTLSNFRSKGQLNLTGASLQYPEMGTHLKHINSQIRLVDQRIIIDSLRLDSGKGFLSAQGLMDYSQNQSFSIDSLKFDILSKDLHLFNSEKISTKLDSQLNISQIEGRNLVQGQITFKDSKVNLNKFKKNHQQSLVTPLLLQAEVSDSLSQITDIDLKSKRKITSDADIQLILPRNTWIKDQHFELEITGNIQVKKSGELVSIYGEINSQRGNISYYGKKFNIEEAQIIFNDKDYLNPELMINAFYRFREGNERRKINLIITGSVKQIQINFLLDGKTIEEKDAISYIVFGRNLDQLSSREQSSLNSGFNASEVFGSIFLNSITGKINDKVKDVLNLDVLDINGANPYGNSEIEAGKYFGDRVFISYSREFNLFNNKQINNESFNIEYQISKRLFLSGTQSNNQSSGIDLYFKWER